MRKYTISLFLACVGFLDAQSGFVTDAIVVPEEEQQKKLVSKVEPRCPHSARIDAQVGVTVVIGEDGLVEKVFVSKSHPLVRKSIIEAVKQWRYQPTNRDGKAVRVITCLLIRLKC